MLLASVSWAMSMNPHPNPSPVEPGEGHFVGECVARSDTITSDFRLPTRYADRKSFQRVA
jgi:hypothetical protein